MHGYSFLCLPVIATGLNLLLAIFLFGRSPQASASLVPVQYEQVGGASNCVSGDGAVNEEQESCSSTYIFARNVTIEEGPAYAAEDDPALEKMPGRDFNAYVRPDGKFICKYSQDYLDQ